MSAYATDSRVIAIGWDGAAIPAKATVSVVKSLCQVTPQLEVTRPNLCTIPARGPSRYYGSEADVCRRLRTTAHRVLCQLTPDPRIAIGVADTRFAAHLASSRDLIVPPGHTGEFLAELPIIALEQLAADHASSDGMLAELMPLCQLLQRLGLHTLGAFAALPADAVAMRFGALGTLAHRIARGEQPTPLNFYEPPDPPVAALELDPPAERVDIALFAARSLVEQFLSTLADRGLACSRLRVHAETEHGENISRHWRALTVFEGDTIMERLRWQLTGWLDGRSGEAQPTAGISLLRLHADEVVRADDLQLGLWGEMSANDRRAARGLDRIRGLLGPGSVHTTMLIGGRGPSQRFQLRPWGEDAHPAAEPRQRDQPWPGHLPPPAPAIIHSIPLAANCRGSNGRPVAVTGRGALSAPPSQLQVGDHPWRTIVGWAGPWLSDESWWNPGSHRRIARFQVLLDDQSAYLCVVDQGQWWVEASYD